MLDLAKLKQQLVDSGAIDRERLDRAQKYAFEENIPLGEALIALNILGYRKLGQVFSDIYELPYVTLLNSPPPEEAKTILSAKAAIRWKVVAVSYDRSEQVLILAIHDPDQIPKLEKISRFYMQPYSLAFTICSKVELDKAQETYYGAARSQPALDAERKQREKAAKQKLSGLHKPEALAAKPAASEAGPITPAPATEQGKPPESAPPGLEKTYQSAYSFKAAPKPAAASPLPSAPPAEQGQAGRSLKPQGAGPDHLAYKDMSQSLLNAAALLVRQGFAGNSAPLLRAQSRVRYCQLLAARLGFSPVQIDAAVLAAWLSALPDPRAVVKEFLTPYKLDEILLADISSAETVRSEALVLSLIQRYQELQEHDPENARDVNLVRRNLRLAWSSAAGRQNILETFLQVLLDEKFLAKLGRTTGRILIVDPAEVSAAQLAPPLMNDGYDVVVVPNDSSAEEKIADKKPDVCIVALDLPRQSGLKFCQKLKTTNKTADIPCIALMDRHDEKRAAECLRAGVDEVLSKPVDLELLFLKLQRLIKPPVSEEDKAGVKGSLADMSFTDMIQILCAGGRSMEIILTQDDLEGRVYIETGNIVHAVTGDKEGEAAFFEMMRWQRGEFTTAQCDTFPRRTIQSSAMSLLMQGTRLADESAET